MAVTTNRFSLSPAAPAATAPADRRGRWQALRDLLGGALLLAAWLALWTVTWAAVAGPLSPLEPVRDAAVSASAIQSL